MKFLNCILFTLVSFVSCTKSESDPASFEGYYTTNGLFDPSCVALDPKQLPTLTILISGNNSYSIILNKYRPVKSESVFHLVSLVKNGDIQELMYKGSKIGDWKVNLLLENKPKLVTIRYTDPANPSIFEYFVGEEK